MLMYSRARYIIVASKKANNEEAGTWFRVFLLAYLVAVRMIIKLFLRCLLNSEKNILNRLLL